MAESPLPSGIHGDADSGVTVSAGAIGLHAAPMSGSSGASRLRLDARGVYRIYSRHTVPYYPLPRVVGMRLFTFEQYQHFRAVLSPPKLPQAGTKSI